MIEVNGIAHIILTVSRFEECRTFYKRLLPFLGLQLVFDGEDMCYHVGARTGVGIQRCAPEHQDERFVQMRTGLHHFCFRARSTQDVDQVYDLLQELNATIVHAAPRGGRGHRAITRSYLKTRTASGLR